MLLPFMLGGLASAIANRSMDPLVTSIAREFDVSVTTAALAISFYALPYAFSQPILGPLGDYYGKLRLLRICLWLQTLALALVVFSPTLWVLFAARFMGGFAGGGVFPVTMAIIGDRFPASTRQVAMGRFLSAGLIGVIFAASLAGILAQYVSWRAVFVIGFLVGLVASFVVTFFVTSTDPPPPDKPIRIADAIEGYRRVFANPRAVLCYLTVFVEGIALYGMFPYVAEILETRGMGGPLEAGIILGAVGVGGLAYSLSLSVLLKWLGRGQMMFLGGIFASMGVFAVAFALPWEALAFIFSITGLGFLMLHNSMQAEVASLTSENRGSAFSMHSFSFFTGQALGPLAVGAGIAATGYATTLVLCGLTLAALGPIMAWLFARLRRAEAGAR